MFSSLGHPDKDTCYPQSEELPEQALALSAGIQIGLFHLE